MAISDLNESELKEILELARAGEKTFKEMSDRATMIAEKWRARKNTIKTITSDSGSIAK